LVAVKQVGNTLVVRVSGEFDMVVADAFREKIDQHLETGETKNLILDLRGVSFIDSSGLGAILGRYKKICQLNGRMAVVGANPPVKKVLEISGIMKVVSFFNDEKSALAQLP